jgi:eukaryotic-like serine/threonine-protein kinase
MDSTVTLTIVNGPLQGQSYPFSTRTICWVGRQDNCTIRFPDVPEYDKISRLHCLIDIDPPKISIRDFNSTQGTFVDMRLIGRRASGQVASTSIDPNLKPTEENLHSGNIISLGDIHIKVSISGDQPDYNTPAIPKPAKGVRLLADRAITLLKNLWEAPDSSPTGATKRKDSVIGGYKILQKLGEGGYGEVFLAENDQGQQIALKVMLAEVAATHTRVKMFEREIDNAKALKHPHIVRLLDNGFDPQGNCLYYAMEYCVGGNLSTFMDKMGGALSPDLVKPLILQILNGLDYTHKAEIPFVRLADGTFEKGHGLVHRDLKPSNIMLAKTNLGQVAKIGDFGLSKAFDMSGLSGHTVSGDGFRGTSQFMCRKQILEFQDVQPEVDVWAAAACLYYMLTNEYPRNFRSGEGWEVVLDRPVIPILDRNPDLPLPLATVIDRALAEDSNNREALHYQSAQALKADLLQSWIS